MPPITFLATPDGRINDPTDEHLFSLLEVKCPYSYEYTPTEACSDSKFCCELHHQISDQ